MNDVEFISPEGVSCLNINLIIQPYEKNEFLAISSHEPHLVLEILSYLEVSDIHPYEGGEDLLLEYFGYFSVDESRKIYFLFSSLNISRYSDQDETSFLVDFRHLKCLTLRNVYSNDESEEINEFLNTKWKERSRLKHLRVYHWDFGFFSTLKSFPQLEQLQSLELHKDVLFTGEDDEDYPFAFSSKLPNLRKLVVHGAASGNVYYQPGLNIHDTFFENLQLRNLVSLKMMETVIKGRFLSKLTSLRELHIESCRELHDLSGLAKLKHLRSLTVKNMERLLLKSEQLKNVIPRLEALEIIRVHKCDTFPLHQAKSLPNLRRFRIDLSRGCRILKIPNDGRIRTRTPNLKSLSLHMNDTYEGILTTVDYGNNLEDLKLWVKRSKRKKKRRNKKKKKQTQKRISFKKHNLENLKKIHIHRSRSDIDQKRITEYFTVPNNLEELIVEGNHPSAEKILKTCRKIKRIRLLKNSYESHLKSIIPLMINLPHLEILELKDLLVDSGHLQEDTVLDEMFRTPIPSLRVLKIRKVGITGTGFHESFFDRSVMKNIVISSCRGFRKVPIGVLEKVGILTNNNDNIMNNNKLNLKLNELKFEVKSKKSGETKVYTDAYYTWKIETTSTLIFDLNELKFKFSGVCRKKDMENVDTEASCEFSPFDIYEFKDDSFENSLMERYIIQVRVPNGFDYECTRNEKKKREKKGMGSTIRFYLRKVGDSKSVGFVLSCVSKFPIEEFGDCVSGDVQFEK